MTKSTLIALLGLIAAAACSDTADTSPEEPAPRAAARAPAVEPPSLSCGVDSGTVLTGDGIGSLRIGAPVTELSEDCRIVRDSVMPFREGSPERVLVVRLRSDTVRALVEDGRVTLLFVHSPAFRTAGRLGVGSTIEELRATGPGTVSREEGTHIKLGRICGLVFYPGPMDAPLRATLTELPANATVARVVVAGCGESAKYYSP